MATPPNGKIPNDPALNAPWTAYRLWADTAKYHRNAIDRLTHWSLGLAIGGAIFVTLGEQVGPLVVTTIPFLTKVTGAIGAGAITLSAYLSKQAQADDRESIWTRCRSAAESLKSASFLYRASAPPFDGSDRASRIKEQTEKVIGGMSGVEQRPQPSNKSPELNALPVDAYITARVQEQIDWYTTRAGEHQKSADLCRTATTVLMGVSALLALASAVSAASIWAPVLGTITAAITAYLKNQQYQMLVAMYQTTAMRLNLIKGEWEASGKTNLDLPERNAFITRCEETMAAENGSWLALWSKKDSGVK
jgi:hypothetical protein